MINEQVVVEIFIIVMSIAKRVGWYGRYDALKVQTANCKLQTRHRQTKDMVLFWAFLEKKSSDRSPHNIKHKQDPIHVDMA